MWLQPARVLVSAARRALVTQTSKPSAPPFFSIVLLHFGQSCVLMESQLNVSLSSSHFLSHALTVSQLAGACGSWLQLAQKAWPAPQVTNCAPAQLSTASEQPATGHHTAVRLWSTKLLRRKNL